MRNLLNKKNKNQSAVNKGKKWERFDSSKQKKAEKKGHSVSPLRKRSSPKEPFSFKGFFDSVFDLHFNHDKKLFYVLIAIIVSGIVFVYSSSLVASDFVYENKYAFFVKHLRFLAMGGVAFAFFYFIKPQAIAKIWFVFLGINVILLIFLAVMGFIGKGDDFNGANRWVNIGGLSSFQPSEFVKLAFVIFAAAFLSKRKTHYKDFREYFHHNLLPYLFWFGMILFLIVLGKNLSTAIIVGFVGVGLYGVSSITSFQKKAFLALVLFGIVMTGILTLFEGYRADRLAIFTNYWKTGETNIVEDGRNKYSDHFDIAISSTGSGGLWGVGLGRSTGKYHLYYTSAGDDLIMSVIAEELGFVLASLFIFLYFYFVYRCLSLASTFVDDPVNYYMLIGCALWIGFQAFTHIAANFGVIPLTGQTLPFVSIGGSSLISVMAAAGIVLNTTKRKVGKGRVGLHG